MKQNVFGKTGLIKFVLPTMALLLTSLFLFACGGGRKTTAGGEGGQDVDIDSLLEGGEQATQPSAADDETEVLKLLGIVPENKAEEAKPQEAAAPAAAPANLNAEVERLQRELQSKDQQISSLRADVSEKDRRLQALQTELESAQRRSVAPSTRIAGDYAQRYAQARDLYEQKRYNDAIAVFAALLAQDDRNSLADNCQYWIGECYYGLGNFVQSAAEFQKVLAFSRSDKLDDAHLKLGLCYLRTGDRARARSELEQLLAIYPNSEYVEKARRYLSRM
ncbi:tetratricopeptide repeat protein [candidate division KSB1 bacterium]|nr:MAG: tetratricopeptide repeat protein [candidate division KSB1 bacterium]MCE7943340.1 tetratricopeptide repeat protein [Chlorobi bacterium CHB1]MDL1874626.1 tetratricopeptide repeat protein [Cytophagia bacterium CHB2]